MFYLLKVLYSAVLLPPGLFILALLLLAWWLRRKNRPAAKAVAVLAAIFYIASTGIAADAVVRSLENVYTPPKTVSGDVIVMLGGGATLDTPNMDWQGHLFGTAANRLLTTAQLYNKLGVPIIISGGKILATSGLEADIAKHILVGLGVPENKVLTETASLNTTQNAQNVAELLQRRGFKRPILVTSAFHMERSVLQFKKAGLEVAPFPAGYLVNVSPQPSFFDLLPSASALDLLALGLKEYLGIAAVKWY